MTVGLAEARERSTAEGKKTLFADLAARFGDRFSLSQSLREQHANTLTWLKTEPPDAVLFAE
ncbi:MAG: FAD-binding oxidoreductase, partial [Methyloceanibacter sp.]|nr:FAD-binding oxidoreductase [Methyloceanibacter sp.]